MHQEIIEKKKHTHTIYNSLHLDRYEKKELNKLVKTRPNITAAAAGGAISGIDPSTGEITKSVRKINNLMANHGRTKYEIRRSKIQQDLYTTKEDAVATFQDLDEKYPYFMDSAQILPSKFFCELLLTRNASTQSTFCGPTHRNRCYIQGRPKGLLSLFKCHLHRAILETCRLLSSDNQKQQRSSFQAVFCCFV